MLKSILFYIPTGANIIAILVAVYFLVTDAMRYSSSSNGPLLLVTLLMCGWVGLCFYLRTTPASTAGTILAWIPAIPLLGYGLMLLMFMILKPDMK
jgi:hypothetical protein